MYPVARAGFGSSCSMERGDAMLLGNYMTPALRPEFTTYKNSKSKASSVSEKSVNNAPGSKSRSTPGKWIRYPARVLNTFTWRTGIKVSLTICLFAFFINLTIILMVVSKKGETTRGIGVLNTGQSTRIAQLGAIYHVLINVLSTGLLTSSNYYMQLLCAPTQHNVDLAHARGQYLDVSILSLRNMRYISRRRSSLWLVLATSSLPLHLLYNSAIFTVIVGQQYNINIVNGADTKAIDMLKSNYTALSSGKWQAMYDTRYISGGGNLWLVADKVAFDIAIDQNSSRWHLAPLSMSIDDRWSDVAYSNPMSFQVTLQVDGDVEGTYTRTESSPQNTRIVVPLTNYTSAMPKFEFPSTKFMDLGTNHTWRSILGMRTDGWIIDPPIHLDSAFSQPLESPSSVQVALPFMIVVLVCNALKAMTIYWTLRASSAQHLITQGDAIASFLERPDMTTLGCCTLNKTAFIRMMRGEASSELQPWAPRSQVYNNTTGGRILSNLILASAGIVTILSIVFAMTGAWKWGTSSTSQLSLALKSFNTNGVLFNAWLANAPQLLLSISYFAINRLCTSMCFTKEWNDHGLRRKGLRVTTPKGKQRPAHFLQLPFRWAIPLTTMAGILHWLLSQSFFLVRLDIRDSDGGLQTEDSRSTCGYSGMSLVTFSTAFFCMLAVVYRLQIRSFKVAIPPAEHCSFVISAACHPDPSDAELWVEKVQWGVVQSGFGEEVGHCSFVSEQVGKPVEGSVYT